MSIKGAQILPTWEKNNTPSTKHKKLALLYENLGK